MKFLIIFADMLRPNLLNSCNPEKKEGKIDKWLKKNGGVLYTRAYTHGPDTPRSHGCLWSGQLPIENGCNTRVKYPRWNLKNPNENFLSVLKENNYSFNFIIRDGVEKAGMLPTNHFEGDYYSKNKDIAVALSEIQIQDNSLTYIDFHDYHYCVDDFYTLPSAHDKGDDLVGRGLELISTKLELDSFDLMIFYSDHGWRTCDEKMDTMLQQMGDNRSQVFLLVREKGDKKLVRNDKLCCITDVGKTICDYAGIPIPYFQRGISLFDKNEHDYIVIEDFKRFSITLDQAIEMWGIRTRDNFICTDYRNNWESLKPITEEELKHWDEVLEIEGSCYKDNKLFGQIMELYKGIKADNAYWDGSLRNTSVPVAYRIRQVKRRISKIFHISR